MINFVLKVKKPFRTSFVQFCFESTPKWVNAKFFLFCWIYTFRKKLAWWPHLEVICFLLLCWDKDWWITNFFGKCIFFFLKLRKTLPAPRGKKNDNFCFSLVLRNSLYFLFLGLVYQRLTTTEGPWNNKLEDFRLECVEHIFVIFLLLKEKVNIHWSEAEKKKSVVLKPFLRVKAEGLARPVSSIKMKSSSSLFRKGSSIRWIKARVFEIVCVKT